MTKRIFITSRRFIPAALVFLWLQIYNCLSIVVSPKVLRVSVGSTGLTLSEIGIGTWQWGNRLLYNYNPDQDKELYQTYRVLRDAGVTLFDTADSYGTFDLNGRAELLLGQFERNYLQQEPSFRQKYFGGTHRTKKQQVATKLAPYPWRITPKSIVDATKASLTRLGQDKLTLAQLHWSASNYLPFQENALWEGIADTYDQGLCEAVGVSNYGPQQLEKFAQRMEERKVPLATAQIQYSLLTYKDPSTPDMVQACRDINNNNMRLIAYSPLALGLLTCKYSLERLPPAGNPRRQLFLELLPGVQPLLNLLQAIATEMGKTPSQVAINWTMCKGCIPIPGARTVQQATDNVGAAGWRLSKATVEELDRTAISISKPMIQNIFQTK